MSGLSLIDVVFMLSKNFLPAWVAHCAHLNLFSIYKYVYFCTNVPYIDQDVGQRLGKSEIFPLALDPNG